MLCNLLSDYEILRIRLILIFDFLSCNRFRGSRIPWFRPQPYPMLQKDELMNPMGKMGAAWKYTQKHFLNEQIQDTIDLKTHSNDKSN